MNKAQFIAALAPHFNDSKREAAHAVDIVFDTITRTMARGEDVMINDFGKFKKVDRKDLVLMELAEGSTVAAVFTRNAFCAAPVTLAREHLLASAGRPGPRGSQCSCVAPRRRSTNVCHPWPRCAAAGARQWLRAHERFASARFL